MKSEVTISIFGVFALIVAVVCISVSSGNQTYDTKVIDGCEYLERDDAWSYKAALTHKGNCSNRIQTDKD